MSEAWPAGLPALPLYEGLSQEYPDVLIRSSTDVGPIKIRRRVTTASTFIHMRFLFTSTQLAIWKTFYETTIARGATSILITNPLSGVASSEARIHGIPQLVPVGPSLHKLIVTMEFLP